MKNCPTPSGLPIPVANKIQNAIQYKDRSPDWWCLAHTMTSARAWGRSNRLLMSAICNTGVAVHLTHLEDIWDYSFYAQRIVSKYARIFKGQLSDSGTQSKFWFCPVSIKRTNLQKSSTRKMAVHCPTVMSVERSITKGQSSRLEDLIVISNISWNNGLLPMLIKIQNSICPATTVLVSDFNSHSLKTLCIIIISNIHLVNYSNVIYTSVSIPLTSSSFSSFLSGWPKTW